MVRATRLRRWSFVLNNWTQAEKDTLLHLGGQVPTSSIRYLCWGEEVGPETGTPHFQGYAEFFSPTSMTGAKKLLGGRIHLTKCDGTADQNRKYCQKTREQDPVPNAIFEEFGAISVNQQGKRNDILEMKEAIDEGASNREIWDSHFRTMLFHHRGVAIYRKESATVVSTPRFPLDTFPQHFQDLTSVITWTRSLVISGPSDIGKTEFAKTLIGPGFLFVSHMDDLLKFKPGEHTGLIFDDMSFEHLHREAQIHLCDQDNERSIHCRFQCATIPANTKKIFTTNNDSGTVFLNDAAIRRRTHLIKLV